MENKLFQNENSAAEFMEYVLKLPWNNSFLIIEPHIQQKAKCLSLQVVSKMDFLSRSGNYLEVLDLGLRDKAEVVRMEAIIAMPTIVFWSGSGLLTHVLKRMG